MTAGGYITYPAIQSDEFIGTQANGNRMGNISTATFNSATNDLEGLWSGPYGMIASVNYFLPKVEALLHNAELSDDALASLHRYKGEAHWARAFAYYTLVKFYCDAYNRIDPQAANTGVPLVTVYAPSGDYASYPGRSSLAETYAQIESDLNTSYSELNTFETSGVSGATANLAPNASYLSTLAVEAFQARIALLKGDWATAVSKAEDVINSGVFALETGKSYYDMWETDEGTPLYENLLTIEGIYENGTYLDMDFMEDETTGKIYVALQLPEPIAWWDASNYIWFMTFNDQGYLEAGGRTVIGEVSDDLSTITFEPANFIIYVAAPDFSSALGYLLQFSDLVLTKN